MPDSLFKASSSADIEDKKRRAEAPKRKSHVRSAATNGDVQAVLEFLETIQDPAEATELALDAHKYLTLYRHTAGVRVLERECDGLFGGEDAKKIGTGSADDRAATPGTVGTAGAGAGPAVQYDHTTAQILTGKIGSIMLHVDRGVNLPIRDGTTGSSDPFVRAILWEKDSGGVRRRAADVSTQIKLMTCNPVFDENFVLHVGTPESELELSAYDWDEDGTHDFMGCVVIPLREFIGDLIRQRDNTYRQNLAAARAVSQTAGSKNIAGRSLGGTVVKPVNQYYGADTAFGRVGWDDATGIKALATSVQRSSELPELRPKLHHADLRSLGGGKSAEGGQLIFTLTYVPAFRPKAIANVPMFPCKTLEHITPMTPANQLVFEDKEFLHSSVAEDATFAKSRTLTDDVMWPKAHATSSMETTSLVRSRQLAHLTWRNMIEPTRPYKQPLPAGVCKDPKTGMNEMEDKANVTRRADEDIALNLADQLWGQRIGGGGKLSLNQRLQRAAGKALDAKAYRTRSDATKVMEKGQALFEEYRYLDAIALFENALRIAIDGKDKHMMAVSHKWLGDSWHLVGDFRKAREHHTKHMQFNSADVSDLSGESGVRDKTQVLALCRQERLTGAAAKYVLDSVAKTSTDQQQYGEIRIPPKDLALAVQEARSYHDDKYWLNRARVRLDRVNWSEGASRLTMDQVRDAITDMKLERAGELKPVYVQPSMWGERRF